jgi:MFS family permease
MMEPPAQRDMPLVPAWRSPHTLAVLVAALGYFVDIYDLILFNVVRWDSLADLGLTPERATAIGIWLLDLQLIGMVIGGVAWGMLGDLRGRASVLFGSIVLYSVANLLNAGVGAKSGALAFMGHFDAITAYAVLRFMAGVGLAGELGAGVTLVAEMSSRHGRGLAIALIGAVGVVGAVAAGVVGELAGWRMAYLIGGVMGLALLGLRFGVLESGMFSALERASPLRSRGLLPLLRTPRLLLRIMLVVLAGSPIWFTLAVPVALAPRIARDLGLDPPPRPGVLVALYYSGAVFGDLASGLLSQWMRSRRKAMAIFMSGTAIGCTLMLTVGAQSAWWYGAMGIVTGFCSAYWIVTITMASELFGTNVRATVTTTVPNLIRVSAVPVTALFVLLTSHMSAVTATALTGALCFAVAGLALWALPEPFGRDLDYQEL